MAKGDCNVAAIREALIAMKKSIDELGAASLDGNSEIVRMSLPLVCEKSSALIDAALAAPPRNCDVGTVEEQLLRFRDDCLKNRHKDCMFCHNPPINLMRCCLSWAQMPYEKGGAK